MNNDSETFIPSDKLPEHLKKPLGIYRQQPENITTSSASSENVTVISPFLTAQQICAVLHINKRTLKRRVESKQIKRVIIGGCVLYPIKENRLQEYLR